MSKSISEHERERREREKFKLSLVIPVMRDTEELSRRCNLDVCFVYSSQREMADYLASYQGDPSDLSSKAVGDFQAVYRSVIAEGLEHFDYLFDTCESFGLFGVDENSKTKNLEIGMPLSKPFIARRRDLLESRAKRHVKQLTDGQLSLKELPAIQESFKESLGNLFAVLIEMFEVLASHSKTMRDKDRLKWSKIGVFVGAGGNLSRMALGSI